MRKKKKDEVIKMFEKTTYKVEAKCNNTNGINVEFKGIDDIHTAFECANGLEQAFPMVDITNEQTGEVAYSRYIATEFFRRTNEMGRAIYEAECNMCF